MRKKILFPGLFAALVAASSVYAAQPKLIAIGSVSAILTKYR